MALPDSDQMWPDGSNATSSGPYLLFPAEIWLRVSLFLLELSWLHRQRDGRVRDAIQEQVGTIVYCTNNCLLPHAPVLEGEFGVIQIPLACAGQGET